MILLLKSYPCHFVSTILSIPFCPIPFCPYTILSISFCPYHFVRYHFVRSPFVLVTAYCLGYGTPWCRDMFCALQTEGRRFESTSSHCVATLDKLLTHNCV